MSDEILVERDGGIATVVFNRPKMRNAVSLAMWGEIANVTEALSRDDAVRAVVYRGAGRDAFASGADISEFKENRKDTETALAYNKKTEAAYTAIRLCPKPTVAMVFGFCMGGAMALAMACDLRVAAVEALMGLPEVRVGVPSVIEAALLPQLIGPGRAAECLLTGESITAARALEWGLVNRVAPSAQLEEVTTEIVDRILACAPNAIRLQKELMVHWRNTNLRSAVEYGINAFAQAYATEEPREAMRPRARGLREQQASR